MDTKVGLFFLLNTDKAKAPSDFGMNMPVSSIAPLYESLEENCRFTKVSYSDCTVYGLSYFSKPYQTDMLVVVRDMDSIGRKHLETQCAFQIAEMLSLNEPAHYGEYLHQAIWLPRGLQKQEFLNKLNHASGDPEPNLDGVTRKYMGSNWSMNYHRGFIFGGKQEASFARSLVLYGLGLAYHFQLSAMINRLSQMTTLGGDQLNRTQLDVQRFCAQYLFDNPVRARHHEQFENYQLIVKTLDLPRLEQQLRKKMQDLQRLGELKSSRESIEGGLGLGLAAESRPSPGLQNGNGDQPQRGGSNKLLLGALLGIVVAAAGLAYSDSLLGWLRALVS
ncbi:hypothetical protein [Motiliproteus sp.]|uniref:hypothetical protein n=1 Tax=Motiliproteus sp. TaxID=1898955 RepID=UPI003BAD77F5